MKPKISFVIAAYNEQSHIEDCVNSCLEQTYSNIEVCVTDDGSSDETWKLLKSLESDNVKIHRFESNKGKVFAFNHSFSMATGDYIAIIGADDVNLPNRVEEQLNFLNENNLDLTWGGFVHIDENGDELKDYHTPLKQFPQKIDILQDNFIPGNTIFLKKEVADKIFPIPEQLKFEDWWIAFNTIFNFRYKMLNRPVIKYRIHANNTVGNTTGDYVQLRRKNIKRHIKYHELFAEKLADGNPYFSLNKLALKYKLVCLEDSFVNRTKLFLEALRYFRLKYLKLIIKLLTVTVLGLRGVQIIFK